jgi:hypothetical protein
LLISFAILAVVFRVVLGLRYSGGVLPGIVVRVTAVAHPPSVPNAPAPSQGGQRFRSLDESWMRDGSVVTNGDHMAGKEVVALSLD